MAYPHNGILFGQTKNEVPTYAITRMKLEHIIIEAKKPDTKGHAQSDVYIYMKNPVGYIHRSRVGGGFQGVKVSEVGRDRDSYGLTFCSDEHAPELVVMVAKFCRILKTTELHI